jgi:Zn-dependent protease
MLAPGVIESRWAPWSSTPALGRFAVLGGFDPHSLPPFHLFEVTLSLPEPEILTNLVSRVFRIDDVTTGDPPKEKYLFRYRGLLLQDDSAAAYDQLSESLTSYGITPLFRVEGERQVIYLVKSQYVSSTSRVWVNILLFVLTVLSVWLAGAMYTYSYNHPNVQINSLVEMYRVTLLNFWDGLPFAISLMAILLAHEFGHYIVGRLHKADVTLPYFIPMPIPGGFGTMGAVIQMKSPSKNRRSLLEIGIAGPVAGLVVAIPVLLLGLSLSKLGPVQPMSQLEGNSILYLLLKYAVFGKLLPAPVDYNGVAPIVYWVRYVITATPSPIGGLDVQLNPIAWAGWVGLLVTSLNLIPAGQLDGGHVMYALVGKGMRKLLVPIMIMLAALGFFWMGWWLWVFLLLAFGRISDEPLDQITQLDGRRKVVAVLVLILFILVFIPIPLALV